MYWYTNVSYLAINLDKLGNTLPGFWKSLSIFILFIVVYIYIGPPRPDKMRTRTISPYSLLHSNPNWPIIGPSGPPSGYESRRAKSEPPLEYLTLRIYSGFGTNHGFSLSQWANGILPFTSSPKYDWILLEAISNVVKKPSVMHVSVFIKDVYCITFNERLE